MTVLTLCPKTHNGGTIYLQAMKFATKCTYVWQSLKAKPIIHKP